MREPVRKLRDTASTSNQTTLDEWMTPTKIKCEYCRQMYSKNLRISHERICGGKKRKLLQNVSATSTSVIHRIVEEDDDDEIQFVGEFKPGGISSNSKQTFTIDEDESNLDAKRRRPNEKSVVSIDESNLNAKRSLPNESAVVSIDDDEDEPNFGAERHRPNEKSVVAIDDSNSKKISVFDESPPLFVIETVRTIKLEDFPTALVEPATTDDDEIFDADRCRSPSLLEPIKEKNEREYDENSEVEDPDSFSVPTTEDAIHFEEDDRSTTASPELFDETAFLHQALMASTPLKKIPADLSSGTPSTSTKPTDGTEEENNQIDFGNPYFLKIFEQILNRIRRDEWQKNLFSSEHREIFDNYDRLSDGAKICFVRLFTRKLKWDSPKSFANSFKNHNVVFISDCLRELKQRNFVDSIGTCHNVDLLLNLLSSPDLRRLAVDHRIIDGSCKERKNWIVVKFTNELRTQSAFCGDRTRKVLETLHKKLNGFCRINESVRLLFLSVFHLYSPLDMSSKNLHMGGNFSKSLTNELIFTLLQKERGEIKFVNRTGLRKKRIFPDRDQLTRYVRANELEAQIIDSFYNKRYEECIDFGQEIKSRLIDCLSDEDRIENERRLPSGLRRFTPTYVYARCIFLTVQAMQFLKRFQSAVDILFWILNEIDGDFAPKRDQYYERLAINLKEHLKQPEKAFVVIERAFNDLYVKDHGKQTLIEKAKKYASILSKKNAPATARGRKKRNDSSTDEWSVRLEVLVKRCPVLLKISEKTIHGNILSKSLGGKRKHIFVEGERCLVPVEQLAMDDYKKTENFTEALHDEGAALKSLFGILLWNQIYDHSVADVWQSSQQWEPLDFNDTDSFKNNRPEFTTRITEISQASDQFICQWIDDIWSKHHGTRSIVVWDCFSDVDQAKRLASCIGGILMCTLFYILSSDYKSKCSGFPDLTLWNAETKKFKVVEVKGPGDVLSTKQKMWLSQFTSIGVDAELCKVVGSFEKKFKAFFSFKFDSNQVF